MQKAKSLNANGIINSKLVASLLNRFNILPIGDYKKNCIVLCIIDLSMFSCKLRDEFIIIFMLIISAKSEKKSLKKNQIIEKI